MSSYGRNKTFAAIILTIAVIVGLRVVANVLMPEPPAAQEQTEASSTSIDKD